MFDIGFFEMLLVGFIALVVLGPERLPKAARTLGLYVGKMRRTWLGLRNELMREVEESEFRREMAKMQQELDALKQPSLERIQALEDITREFKETVNDNQADSAKPESITNEAVSSKPQGVGHDKTD